MDIDEVRTFLAIAETGGFTRAGQRLHRSQPAISRRLDLLEHELGRHAVRAHARPRPAHRSGPGFPAPRRGGARRVEGRAGCGARPADGPAGRRLARAGRHAGRYPHRRHAAAALPARPARCVSSCARPRARKSPTWCGAARRRSACATSRATGRTWSSSRPAAKPWSWWRPAAIAWPAAACALPGTSPASGGSDFRRRPATAISSGHLLARQLIRAGLEHADLTLIDSLTAQKRLAQAGFGLALVPESSVRDELRQGTAGGAGRRGDAGTIPITALHRRNGYLSPAAKALLALLTDVSRRP